MQGLLFSWIAVGICIGVSASFAFIRLRALRASRREKIATVSNAQTSEPAAKATVVRGSVSVVRPNPVTIEGMEIRYAPEGLVRAVRIGAMNSEHKELLLTMDAIAWQALTNSHKQEVLAVARSTWAAKMCPDGPDIAYVVLATESGEIVGRADPHSVRIL